MSRNRAALEAAFLRLCRLRGPQWIESVIRPLGLPGQRIGVRDIPQPVLAAIVQVFDNTRQTVLGSLVR